MKNEYTMLLVRDLLKIFGAVMVTKGITDTAHAEALTTSVYEILPGVVAFAGAHLASWKKIKNS